MDYTLIRVTRDEGIATVTIARPQVRNALDAATVAELRHAVAALRGEPETQVVVFTGEGDRAFVAGADIRGFKGVSFLERLEPQVRYLCDEMEALPQPTIAAVNGYALGGGCELAMACDLRVASEGAQFGQPEVNLGILPGAGGTQRLARLVGEGRAKELIFTGALIDAAEAWRIGLVNRVVPADTLMDEVRALARTIMQKRPLAVRLAKRAINMTHEASLAAGLEFETLAQTVLFASEDKEEGVEAFLGKRPPRFKGR